MTLGYATAERPISTASDLLDSANQLLDALAMVAVGPALTMLFLLRPIIARGGFKPSYFGICLSAGPVLAMIALSLATRQVIRQGWLVPMIPMIMTGAAIALGGGNLRMPRAPRALGLIGRSCVLSLALMAGYSIELVAWTLAGSPIEAYSFDSKALAAQISNSWKSQSNAPLRCFATSFGNRVLGATLYFHPLPRIVDLTPSGPAMPPCGDTGGVIVILSEAAPASGLDRYGLYSRETDVPAMAEFDNVKWSVKIYVAPPTPRTQG